MKLGGWAVTVDMIIAVFFAGKVEGGGGGSFCSRYRRGQSVSVKEEDGDIRKVTKGLDQFGLWSPRCLKYGLTESARFSLRR